MSDPKGAEDLPIVQCYTWCLVWLRTGSNPVDMSQFPKHTWNKFYLGNKGRFNGSLSKSKKLQNYIHTNILLIQWRLSWVKEVRITSLGKETYTLLREKYPTPFLLFNLKVNLLRMSTYPLPRFSQVPLEAYSSEVTNIIWNNKHLY